MTCISSEDAGQPVAATQSCQSPCGVLIGYPLYMCDFVGFVMLQLILFSTALDFKIFDIFFFFSNKIHFIIMTIFLTFGLCFSEEKKSLYL